MPANSAPLGELTPEQLDGGPAWLTDRRRTALSFFQHSERPLWKRTDLSKLPLATLVPARGTVSLAYGELPAGVIVSTLAEALQANEPLVRRSLGTVVDSLTHSFTALGAALADDGVFIYIPKDTSVELPIHATFGIPAVGTVCGLHSLVVLERGASATFIEDYAGDDLAGTALVLATTELLLGDGASLKYVPVQRWGRGVVHIGSQRALVGRDASLDWAAIGLGGSQQHIDAETALSGDGSRVDWVAATIGHERQQLLTAPWLRHIGANTEGHMDFKTVVKDAAYTTFDGMIKIEKTSRGTISRLEEHALHLSPKARSDSIPGLMIDTNDVAKAGHASTSGEVDDEQLFYMRSRGIDRTAAVNMIVMGFFEPILDRVPSEALREALTDAIAARI